MLDHATALNHSAKPLRATSAGRAMRRLALTGLFASLAVTAHAADANAGKARFNDECTMCHTGQPGDGGGEIGPSLHAIGGKQAATADKNFAYSTALRRSKLLWNKTTLDRFLADSAKAVPGTDMGIAVTSKAARDDLIAYLLSVKPAAPARK